MTSIPDTHEPGQDLDPGRYPYQNPYPVGSDAVPPPPPGTTEPALSEVTRLLSIGAQTDREFGDKVIGELVDNQHRFAAPAYGYDAATVLGHALAARQRRRARTVTLVCVGVA